MQRVIAGREGEGVALHLQRRLRVYRVVHRRVDGQRQVADGQRCLTVRRGRAGLDGVFRVGIAGCIVVALRIRQRVFRPCGGFNGEPPREKPDQARAEQKKDILTVFYSPESGAYSVLSPNNAFTDEELRSLLSTIVSQKDDFGTLRQSRAIYYRSGGEPCRIAIASTDYITRSMGNLALVLLAIWLGAMLLFFAVSVRLSALAARPMEEAVQREKQFIADASHDLKTPLSVILANNAMKAALEMESIAYEKCVTLETALPEACSLRGNTDYLQRIVSSLLENALKYEPAGGRVQLTLTQDKRRVQLSVQSFGSAIPAEDLPHVFDRFYRSDKSRKSESGSFGLGLAITKEMVEKLGGEISVSSSAEDGTVFQVILYR